MNRQLQILCGTALVLIAAAAGILQQFRSKQKLGAPGVKVVPVPLINTDGKIARTNSIFLPDQLIGWLSTNEPVTATETAYLPPDTLFGRRSYISSDGAFRTTLSVVLMGTDRTSIHRPEACLPGQGLLIERMAYTNIVVQKPHRYRLPVRRFDTVTQYEQDGKTVSIKGIFVFWFVTDGELTSDHGARMWSMAGSLLTKGILQRWAYVAAFAPCHPGEEDATFDRLAGFLAQSVPEFQLATGSAAD